MILHNRKIEVFGKTITIKEVDMSSIGSYHGLYVHDKAQILLNKNDSTEQKMETLIHEIGHAIFRRAGLTQAISSDVEEITVDQYSIVLREIFNFTFRKK